MSYQVIARKWRPERFAEVVGQTAIAQTLQNAIRYQRIAHGYLFAGPRGVGKTTMARIFARAINCRQGPTPDPCGACDSCLEIAQGHSLDVLELDAASNRGIDDVRQLREIVRYKPARDRYKILIVDEAHMLTEPAFNALLKTLEEPPPFVVFIFATTEAHKMPATIISRCQQFDFRMLALDLIVGRLRYIAEQEQVEIDDRALELIAVASEGGMRDAQSLLDQVIAFSGQTVNEADVVALLGLVDQSALEQLTRALAQQDAPRILALVNDLIYGGCDVQILCRKLILHLRHLLVVKVAGPDPSLLPLPTGSLAGLLSQSEPFTEQDLLRFYEVLSKTESDMKWSAHPRIHFEIGLLKLIHLRKLVPLEALMARFSELVRQVNNSGAPGPPATASPRQPMSPPSAFKPPGATLGSATPAAMTASAAQPQSGPLAIESNLLPPVDRLLHALEAQQQMLLRALLLNGGAIQWMGHRVEIKIPRAHHDHVACQENLELIGNLCREISGEVTEVKVVVDDEPADLTRSNPMPPPLPPANSVADPLPPLSPAPPADPWARALSEPVIREFLDMFTGELPTRKEER